MATGRPGRTDRRTDAQSVMPQKYRHAMAEIFSWQNTFIAIGEEAR